MKLASPIDCAEIEAVPQCQTHQDNNLIPPMKFNMLRLIASADLAVVLQSHAV
jgi:hypothetical protein